MVDITSAINAYKSAAGVASALDEGSSSSSLNGNTSPFLGMVQSTLDKTIHAGKAAELVSMNAIAGKAEPHELVTAITNAELAVQTIVAVRDRVINAYQDIMKMPI